MELGRYDYPADLIPPREWLRLRRRQQGFIPRSVRIGARSVDFDRSESERAVGSA